MRTDELDFDLPPELIAQAPAERRDGSRLLHYRRSDRAIWHRQFSDLPDLLKPGDLLVLNNTRVLPCRFTLVKPTGGRVDALFVEETAIGLWKVLLRNLGKASLASLRFAAEQSLRADVIFKNADGSYTLRVETGEAAAAILERLGRMPLPPYIHRAREIDPRDSADRVRYQTSFAEQSGSVAAPTAGLHFTQDIFNWLAQRGIEMTFVTLHVGLGTFKPVVAESLDAHVMHRESYSISEAAADALNRAKAGHRRIVAVGTTSARVLESQPADELFVARNGDTAIFIQPGYAWKHVGSLITNFHLPRSTLIALVASLTGLAEQRRVYAAAIEQRYRFFSYGDAMLIE